jgi:hypothetical protein
MLFTLLLSLLASAAALYGNDDVVQVTEANFDKVGEYLES